MSSTDIALLLNKKTVQKMGSRMNENVASKPSSFAMKQMEKMGWTEGKGLGKTESGISTHISIVKRDDSAGLGSEAVEARANAASENWWHDAFASNLKLMKDKHGKKSKSGSKKRKAEDEAEATDEAPPSYDDLFKATGGARLGMRARADQKGKLKRTEDESSSSAPNTANAKAEVATKSVKASSDSGDATTTSSSSDSEKEEEVKSKSAKKEKKEKKEKKDKKEKKEKKNKK